MDREAVEEVKRHFGVVVEGLRSDIRALAEGHQALREEFRREMQDFRQEVRAEFQKVKAMITASYSSCRDEKRAGQDPRETPTGSYAVVREDRRRPRTKACDVYRHGDR
jgi:hypothetical protein